MPRSILLAAAFAIITVPAHAQHDHAALAPGRSPYTGLVQREIKALSDTQVAQYRSGEGMGFALAAELNHYPGPRHALELADSLRLTAEQRAAIAAVRDRMSTEARRLGETIIERERGLDRAFADESIREDALRSLTAEIARLNGELRFVHLRAHLAVRAALSPEQVRRYDRLRGYGEAAH
jgi:Spy/CpxP family protein refolding chaperone